MSSENTNIIEGVSPSSLITQKGTVRKRKPKQKIYYFTKDTEEAILEYVSTVEKHKRDKIYLTRIDFAFFKLTQNIINTFKFHYRDGESIEDLQQEVICFLLEKLGKYTQEKGAAYSYFGTIAKRYLIIKNKNNYQKLKDKTDIEAVDEDKSIVIDMLNNPNKLEQPFDDTNYFIDKFIKYVDLYVEKLFPKSEDAITASAIIELFRKRESLDIFNKKAIFLYLREITKQDTQQITKTIKTLKKTFSRLHNQYLEYGFVSLNF